jgi:hypothetical protein
MTRMKTDAQRAPSTRQEAVLTHCPRLQGKGQKGRIPFQNPQDWKGPPCLPAASSRHLSPLR